MEISKKQRRGGAEADEAAGTDERTGAEREDLRLGEWLEEEEEEEEEEPEDDEED